jgi:hypothetical protein
MHYRLYIKYYVEINNHLVRLDNLILNIKYIKKVDLINDKFIYSIIQKIID